MREIKFRAFGKGKMFMPYDSKVNGDALALIINDSKLGLMQFTGLLDKNGLTEVYECDIISTDGIIKGNIYEMDKRETDIVVPSITSKEWNSTYKELMDRGLKHS